MARTPLHSHEIEAIERTFPGGNVQQWLHERVLERILAMQLTLEHVSADDLLLVQGALRELRLLQIFIHKFDPPGVQKAYAT